MYWIDTAVMTFEELTMILALAGPLLTMTSRSMEKLSRM
jgi:hypothetical protein